MTDMVMLPLAGLAGLMLGIFFFCGLWWTVRKGLASDAIAWWFLISFIVRMGVVVTGFILVAAGRWERVAVCLLGFLIARVAVARMTRLKPANSASLPGITHAS